ncbi:MAG: peptidoglycan DD-metalloendopeptidase family protein [Gammaproteobacteria bacterium SHHR-1]|uniref:peptidoglycan DD-metalloendopeptidase family protein n=1 Tax=Magnetovirga frankeli TaxID=947516 RepID=UPI0012930BDA|nr:peptidoglycan DD-metalloendopeptidase family protein [gamma proteobacterium SS-5]
MMIKFSKRGLALLIPLGLSGCFGFFGEPVRAPVYEGERMVARAGPMPSTDIYSVQPGDTLYSIAWRENMDYRALALWNRLPPDYAIRPGLRLRLQPPVISGDYYAEPDFASGAIVDLQPQDSPLIQHDRPLAALPDNNKQDLVRKAQQLQQRNEQPPQPSGAPGWRKPTQGRLVKAYKPSDLALKGVHLSGREGQPIIAAKGGKVVYSGSGLKGYGNLIIVKHDKNYLSAYGFNRKILVKEGQLVRAGEQIAEMGRSEKGVALLHFEIRHKGKPINPASLVAL